MKKITFLALIAFMFSCNEQTPNQPKENKVTTATSPDGNYELAIDEAKGLAFENLKLYPILADKSFLAENGLDASYLNTKEAFESGKFIVSEKGSKTSNPRNTPHKREVRRESSSGASVNELIVQNTTGEPVHLMAGDLVKGGKQDRVIAEDRILASGKRWHKIPVYCVERGRWSPRNSKVKNPKHFALYGNTSSNSVRFAVINERNQARVWQEVGRVTQANDANSGTGTYNALESSSKYVADRNAYLEFYMDKFENNSDIVGVVAVSGKHVIGCDIFGSPELFSKQFKVLIYAYIADAISYGDKPKISKSKVKTIFLSAVKGTKDKNLDQRSRLVEDGKLVHYSMVRNEHVSKEKVKLKGNIHRDFLDQNLSF